MPKYYLAPNGHNKAMSRLYLLIQAITLNI